MEISFKSFNDIVKNSAFLYEDLDKDYLAHIDGLKPKESLLEHSVLVADYLERLIVSNNLEVIIDHIINQFAKEVGLASGDNLIKELFINSIFFHDLGKVNPNFQARRMKNKLFKEVEFSFDHHHSFPGAYIYCNYYFEKIYKTNEYTDNDKNVLALLVFCFANPIIRHHAPYLDFYKNFHDQNVLKECATLLANYKIDFTEDFSIDIFSYSEYFKDELCGNFSDKANFCIYSLMKLSFSLLTASDFYGTNQFMAGMNVNEFGILNDSLRKKVINNFWSVKDYNIALKKNFDYYLSLPFYSLQERNTENLNFLRQKVTAEVVSTLRKNAENRFYYIEAPTGAGKTNLSLACIAELFELDNTLNKVFYVFPFTTLITQTHKGIKETIKLSNDELIQIHSKTGLHYKNQNDDDAKYGDDRLLYLDHLFVNYPFAITSHIKFFEIVKGNNKESNYLFHRLSNSIVIIDEIQSYDPKHWDKMIYFIQHYAELLNMRFILMSATLPKIDELQESVKGKFISLTPEKEQYFINPNFKDRVEFDFSLIEELKPFRSDKNAYLDKLAIILRENAENYASQNDSKVRVLVEFITKNTASDFFYKLDENELFNDYRIYLLSGDILEPRRQEVINKIKNNIDARVIVVSTQVVEAGVDIDMDLGFKNKALLDSDEQLAGRINRNASKDGCKVFLFELDRTKTIYGKDERYKQQVKDDYLEKNWKNILRNKSFHLLYEKVFRERLKHDPIDSGKFSSYKTNFQNLDFPAIANEFRLIEDNGSESLFIPIDVPINQDFEEIELAKSLNLVYYDQKIESYMISGKKTYDILTKISSNKNKDFLKKKIDLKKIISLVSLFTINVYPKILKKLSLCIDIEKEKYGFKYLQNTNVYSYENGFDLTGIEEDIFL